MQTITFTTDDNISQLLNDIAKEKNQPANEVIAESLRYYADMLQTKKLQQQIKSASLLIIQQSSEDWPADFFEETAGCFADGPLERAPQGDYEQRLELL